MNPLEPNDPLWKLLGKARKVEVRDNFVQDVVRAARHEPQERGLWARVKAWASDSSQATWLRPALVTAAVVIAAVALWDRSDSAEGVSAPSVVQTAPATPVSEDADMLRLAESLPTLPLESVNQMDALLALDDTSALTDTEIAFLLY